MGLFYNTFIQLFNVDMLQQSKNINYQSNNFIVEGLII